MSQNNSNYWKLKFENISNGQKIIKKEFLNDYEINQCKRYTIRTLECSHTNIDEHYDSQISFIENCLPLVCYNCGLIGSHLQDFSNNGCHPFYGHYYNS